MSKIKEYLLKIQLLQYFYELYQKWTFASFILTLPKLVEPLGNRFYENGAETEGKHFTLSPVKCSRKRSGKLETKL